MKIGIVGLGVVGNAIKFGFAKLGHEILEHDIRLDTNISDVLDSEICFICVPTPEREDGHCDTSIVEDVAEEINSKYYSGIIAIKSTVTPGTTEKLQKRLGTKRIAFVPEFLRERVAIADFTENHDVCIIGTNDAYSFNEIKEAHGKYPKKVVQLTPTEAEFSKYFGNAYNATLITFANSFYEICKANGVDYNKVKNAMVNREHINDMYLDVNENFRAFGGVCLPKDLAALDALAKEGPWWEEYTQKKTKVEFFKHILSENAKYPVTVIGDMRENDKE